MNTGRKRKEKEKNKKKLLPHRNCSGILIFTHQERKKTVTSKEACGRLLWCTVSTVLKRTYTTAISDML